MSKGSKIPGLLYYLLIRKRIYFMILLKTNAQTLYPCLVPMVLDCEHNLHLLLSLFHRPLVVGAGMANGV